MGTLYRRFPSKRGLIDALIRDVRRQVLSAAQAARSEPEGGGLERLLHQAGEVLAAQPACTKPLSTRSESGFEEILVIRGIVATDNPLVRTEPVAQQSDQLLLRADA